MEGLGNGERKRRMQEAADFHTQQEEWRKESISPSAAAEDLVQDAAEKHELEESPAPAEVPENERGIETQRWQYRDEGIVILNDDGSVHHVVEGGTDESKEVMWQRAGNAPRGTIQYQFTMLGEEVPRGNPQALESSNVGDNGPQTAQDPYNANNAEASKDGKENKKKRGKDKQQQDAPKEAYDPRADAKAIMEKHDARERGRGGGPPDTGGEPIELPPDPPHDWNVNDKPAFRGLQARTIRELIAEGSPDQLGYGTLLRSMTRRADDILLKLHNQELLSPEEQRILNYTRFEYARRMKHVGELNTLMKESDLVLASQQDEDFSAALGLNGPKRTLEMFKKRLGMVAMMNFKDFERVLTAQRNLKHLRSDRRFLDMERYINELCREKGVALHDYDDVFKTGTEVDKERLQKQFRADIRKGMKPMQRFFDGVLGGSRWQARVKVQYLDHVNHELQHGAGRRVNDELLTLLGAVKYTLLNKEHPEMNIILQQEAYLNKNITPVVESGPKSYKEVRGAETSYASALDAELREHIRRSHKGKTWADMDEAEREESLKPLREARAHRQYRSGQGFWASVFRALADALAVRKERELISKPAIA